MHEKIEMRIVSFDIGLKTCSVAVEDYGVFDGTRIPCEPLQTHLATGEATDEYKAYVMALAGLGAVQHIEKRDLAAGSTSAAENKRMFFGGQAFGNLYAWCTEMKEVLQTADLILIERQLRVNNIAVALMHHLHAWLLITFGGRVKVLLYASKNKTRVLGAPLKVPNKEGKLVAFTKYQRKKWSTEQAKLVLQQRQDAHHLKYIFEENKKKKDDLSDVLMQTLSYVVAHASTVLKGPRGDVGVSISSISSTPTPEPTPQKRKKSAKKKEKVEPSPTSLETPAVAAKPKRVYKRKTASAVKE